MLEKLLVKFAVSKQLPIVGLNFECAIIDFDRENHIILVEDSILPTDVSFIDTNIAKLKTNVENVTYIVKKDVGEVVCIWMIFAKRK